MAGENPTEELRKELVGWVRKEISPIASPDMIQFAPNLPKTRSGKIMRRILRKIAEDEFGNLGDTSTLADPAVVDDLITNRQNRKTTVRAHKKAHKERIAASFAVGAGENSVEQRRASCPPQPGGARRAHLGEKIIKTSILLPPRY